MYFPGVWNELADRCGFRDAHVENEKAERNAVSGCLARKVLEGRKSSIRDATGDRFWYTMGSNPRLAYVLQPLREIKFKSNRPIRSG